MDGKQYERIDQEIQAGHHYVSLHIALGHAKDEAQANDIRATIKALFEASAYIQEVVEYHPQPLDFLASRASASNRHEDNCSNRVLEQSQSSERRLQGALSD